MAGLKIGAPIVSFSSRFDLSQKTKENQKSKWVTAIALAEEVKPFIELGDYNSGRSFKKLLLCQQQPDQHTTR